MSIMVHFFFLKRVSLFKSPKFRSLRGLRTLDPMWALRQPPNPMPLKKKIRPPPKKKKNQNSWICSCWRYVALLNSFLQFPSNKVQNIFIHEEYKYKVYTNLLHELENVDVKLRMPLIHTTLPMMLVVIFTVRGTQKEAVIWESQTFSKGLLQRLIICVSIDFVLVR